MIPQIWVRAVIVPCILLLGMFLTSGPAQGLSCLSLQEHQVCLVRVNRSAKNYWEYRVILQVDGVQQAQEIYNCRDRLRVQANGTTLAFSDQDPHSWVCRLYPLSTR